MNITVNVSGTAIFTEEAPAKLVPMNQALERAKQAINKQIQDNDAALVDMYDDYVRGTETPMAYEVWLTNHHS